jgi:hypothetical protein
MKTLFSRYLNSLGYTSGHNILRKRGSEATRAPVLRGLRGWARVASLTAPVSRNINSLALNCWWVRFGATVRVPL